MKRSALILVATAVFLPVAPASPQGGVNSPVKAPAEASAQKIKDLQKERITTLRELVDQAFAGFRSAQVSYEEVLEAQLHLLNAELDAAEKESERIALYQKSVDVMKKSEEVANARAQTGRGSHTAVLKIKARRLEFEIRLEQAKVKEAKEGK